MSIFELPPFVKFFISQPRVFHSLLFHDFPRFTYIIYYILSQYCYAQSLSTVRSTQCCVHLVSIVEVRDEFRRKGCIFILILCLSSNNNTLQRRASSPLRVTSPHMFGTYTPPRRYSHQEATSGSPVIYSERHIPSRASTALSDQFEMVAHQEVTRASRQRQSSESSSNSSSTALRHEVIRSELLGQPFVSPHTSIANSAENSDPAYSTTIPRSSPSLFRYRSRVSDPEGSSSRRRSSRHFPAAPYISSAQLLPGTAHPYSVPKPPRRIARVPYKVLDAPSLQDDFYLNLLDWSASNVVAVGLGSSVYLWSAYSSKVRCHMPKDV